MERIIGPNTVAIGTGDTAPMGAPGEATNGNPGAGIPPTTGMAWFWNMMQNELIAILAAVGIATDRTNTSQVLAAIKKLIQIETGNYAVDTGADGTHYVIAPNPPIASLAELANVPLRFLAAHSSLPGAGLIVSALPSAAIVRDDGSALQANDIVATGIAQVQYNFAGNKFFLLSTVQPDGSAIQAQGGNYGVDTGASGATIVVALTPVLTAHKAGMPIRVLLANTTLAGATLDPGPGPVAVWGQNGAAISPNVAVASRVATFMYDGAHYILQNVRPATQAEVNTALVTDIAVSPSTLKASPFVVKAWANFHWTGAAVVVDRQQGVSAVVRTGAGTYTFTLTPAALSGGGAIVNANKGGVPLAFCQKTQIFASPATVEIDFFSLATSAQDPDFAFVAFI